MKKIFVAAGFVAALSITSLNVLAQSQSRDELLTEIANKRAEIQKLETDFLAPAEEDRAACSEFLKDPDTGLIRLLPREIYESEVYKKNKKSLVIRGGGSYYSFSLRTHEYGSGTDLGLEDGELKAGFAGANYGMLASLGDISLEEITLDHPAVRYMAVHNAAVAEPQARIEQQRFSSGTTIDNVAYKNRFPVETSAAYLLRTVNFSASDVLVAFRVVRKDTDGSVIIAWKLLKKYPVPKLARNN